MLRAGTNRVVCPHKRMAGNVYRIPIGVYFIHLRRKVQRQDIQAALRYRQPERCVNTGSGDRQCLRRPTFGVEGQRADLLTVQCDLHPSAASRGHTQCGIVLNTCSFFTHIMLAIHLPMQLLLRSRNSPRMLLYRLK